MPKDFPLGNGNIFVNFDQDYNLRDIYYPYVGMENHTLGHLCRFGVWTPRGFAWIGDPEMACEARYLDDALATRAVFTHERLGIELTLEDAVDAELDVLLRRVAVRNLSAAARPVKLYFHLDLDIYGSAFGNTVFYHPGLRSLVFYKRRRYFTLSCRAENESGEAVEGAPGFTTGKKQELSGEGTWKDALDGRLEGNPITQGAVDGTLELALHVPGRAERTGWFWIAFGTCFSEVEQLEHALRKEGPDARLDRTIRHWRDWVRRDRHDLSLLDPDMAAMYKRSLLVVRAHMDNRGAIMAANDSDILKFSKDTYSYMWPRDGALIAHALDRSGYADLTAKFFAFCREGMTTEGYLMHKYNPDGSAGSSWHPWIRRSGEQQLPIQEDETALVLFALWHHHVLADTLPDSRDDYARFVIPAADFLVRYRDDAGLPLPSYDLWEERYGVTAFTVSTVYAGLSAAANFAAYHCDEERERRYRMAADEMRAAALQALYSEEHGRFLRGLAWDDRAQALKPDPTLDAGMYALFDFGLVPLDDPRLHRTMDTMFHTLTVRTPVGGIARYEDDYYHQVSRDLDNVPGNPWFICTLWHAEWLIATAKSERDLAAASRVIRWTHEHALKSGVFAEQVDPYTGEPLSVSPLAWSHSTYIKVVQEYLAKLAEFRAAHRPQDKTAQADAELLQPLGRGSK